MKNQVIEVLNKEHGKKVIEYWKSKGFDVRGFSGDQTREGGEEFRYYGVINNRFNCYTIEFVNKHNSKIIELPIESPKAERTFPRVMLVSDDELKWYKRVVFMKKCNRFLAWITTENIEESECIYDTKTWRYAKEFPEKVELTKSQIAEKFGIPIDLIKIVD